MKYRCIISALFSQPWAILPAKLETIRAFLRMKAMDEDVPEEEIAAIVAGRRNSNVQMAGRVAIVPVMGVIAQRMGMMEAVSGGVGTVELGNTIDSLVADKTVKCIVMQFDSPGGSVFGVEELGRKINAAKNEKKIVAVADSVAASAAYWLASQATEFVVTPSGQIGSIGVISAHQDCTKAEEMQGVKTTIVSSTPQKGEFAPEVALSEEAKAELQSKVDHYYGMFIDAVARGRNTTSAKVRSEFGQGRMVTAKDAVERGMADKVATLEQTLTRLGATADGARAAGAVSEQMAAVRARVIELED